MKTRLILCECPACANEGTPYKARLSRTTLARGAPMCPVHRVPMLTPEEAEAEKRMQARLARERRPLDICAFLARRGGIVDQAGELAHMGIKAGRPCFIAGHGYLIRPSGCTLDYALEAAIERGYFGEQATIADLLDAIDETFNRNRPFYRGEDFTSAAPLAA